MYIQYKFQCVITLAMLVVFLFWTPLIAGEYTYVKEESSFPNPDRGWYSYAPILGNSSFEEVGNDGVRLIYGAITLRDFIRSDISSEVLDLREVLRVTE